MKKYLLIFVALGLMAACEEEPVVIDDSSLIEPIDFGLSVLWGSNNLGATPDHPERLGMLYSWGEIAPKDSYGWDNYKWGGKDVSIYLTKYNWNDNKYKLLPEDDAATFFLGGKWRMPTAKEVKELIKYCNWTVETVNGVPGVRGTYIFSKYVSIFFPFTEGWDGDTPPSKPRKSGDYWTSEINGGALAYAFYMAISNEEDPTVEMEFRANGFPIRPVRDY